MNLLESTYLWIPWIYLIDSGIPGPTVAISACTHGGEHAWLKAINHLMDVVEIKKHLISWKIFFILTNIRAYEQSIKEGNDDPDSNRFVEANLNRCCTVENMESGNSYEAKRAKELEKILQDVDYHLDIHSTYSTPSRAIAISTERSRELVRESLNVDLILENIPQVQVGKPFIDIVERHGGIWLWLEAWYELDGSWFNIWVENSLRLLSTLKMVSGMLKNTMYVHRQKRLIRVHWVIVPTGKNFSTVKVFKSGDVVKSGEVIWSDSTWEYRATKDSIIIMPAEPAAVNKRISEWAVPEEYCFLWEVE